MNNMYLYVILYCRWYKVQGTRYNNEENKNEYAYMMFFMCVKLKINVHCHFTDI